MSEPKPLACAACGRNIPATRADVLPINGRGYISCPTCSHFNYMPDYERFFND